MELKRLVIDFEMGTFEAELTMIDSDGGDDGGPAIRGRKGIHMGLSTLTGIDLEQLEDDVLSIAMNSGRLPAGAETKEK